MLGFFSLTVVLYDRELQTVERSIGEFAGIFTNRDGELFTEFYNQLNAFFAVVPGNSAHNIRKLYLLLSNYADLSFLFTPANKQIRSSGASTSRSWKRTTPRPTS